MADGYRRDPEIILADIPVMTRILKLSTYPPIGFNSRASIQNRNTDPKKNLHTLSVARRGFWRG